MRTDGDYISRKTAYQFFKDQLEEETGAYSKGRNAGLRVAMSAVMNNDAIPAADVRAVRRGKWERMSDNDVFGDINCKCSACGEDWWQGPGWFRHANFCPNCGAKMGGEEE